MNRLASRSWFVPALGTLTFLAGFNDELLRVLGDAWLEIGRLAQTAIAILLLAIVAYLVADRTKQRRTAYRAAVRAARPHRDDSTDVSPQGAR